MSREKCIVDGCIMEVFEPGTKLCYEHLTPEKRARWSEQVNALMDEGFPEEEPPHANAWATFRDTPRADPSLALASMIWRCVFTSAVCVMVFRAAGFWVGLAMTLIAVDSEITAYALRQHLTRIKRLEVHRDA